MIRKIEDKDLSELLSMWSMYRDKQIDQYKLFEMYTDYLEPSFKTMFENYKKGIKESIIKYQRADLELFDYNVSKLYRSGSNFDSLLQRSIRPYVSEIASGTFKGSYKDYIFSRVINTSLGTEEYNKLKDKDAYEKLIDLIQEHLDTAEIDKGE